MKAIHLVLLAVAATPASAQSAGRPASAAILYPLDRSVFPPEITPPLFVWQGPAGVASWTVTIGFASGGQALVATSSGEPPAVGEIDPRAVGPTNSPPVLPDLYRRANSWRPPAPLWEEIKRRSTRSQATFTISADDSSARASIRFTTSPDPVGAPIFYRDVPLMPSETKPGTIKPLAPDAIRLIQWRLRDISKPESRVVLEGMPTCANCHSFSADGKTLAMDLDGPDSDKGTYAITGIAPQTTIRREDVMTWNSFEGRPPGSRTIGFMSQISPDGRFAVSTLNEEIYTANFRDYRFLQVFYPTRGILAFYDRDTKRIEPLPGADDPHYVHTNAVWSPDGSYLFFARAQARDPYPLGGRMAESANDPNELPVRYDLYRIPFNNGRGGRAEPILGASNNGRSNSFPKISPDGRWIVFVQSRNGQLMRPDSELFIVPASGGKARRMNCNTPLMNSWHSFSPNGRWMVFSSKSLSPYTQMFLTHIDENGNDSPAILIENSTAANRAVNIPEFVNIPPDGLLNIDVPAAEFYRIYDKASAASSAGEFASAAALWRSALTLEPDDPRAHNNLGVVLGGLHRLADAEASLRRAIELKPAYAEAHYNLGGVLHRTGRTAEALASWEHALRLMPDFAGDAARQASALAQAATSDRGAEAWRKTLVSAYNDRGVAAARQGNAAQAESNFRKALELDPVFPESHYNLGRVLASAGKLDAAADHWLRALDSKADYPDALFSLASLEAQRGRWGESLRRWLDGLRSQPDFLPALKQSAWILATAADDSLRDPDRALPLALRAAQLAPADPQALDALAAAYAAAGRFNDAAATARKALDIAPAAAAASIRQRLSTYESGRAWREPAIRR
ncbi:MAG: tetratricopeptide repeat protein [Bryobacteraceae bacterium]|nr:tetratricopeptide repeat protein [Bryobacteraceae bacterium]